MLDVVLSLVMLAALALLAGAAVLWRRGVRRQAGLMALLVLVMLGNVAVWAIPEEGGVAPAAQVREGAVPN